MSSVTATGDLDDLYAIAAEQRRELMAAQDLETDLALAFDLQLQEAINASLSLQPSTSSSSPAPPLPPSDDDGLNLSELHSQEISKFEQELSDCKLSQSEFRKIRDDLHRLIHDRKLAAEIERMPEDEWEEYGDDYERPYGEGSSKSVNDEVFRVYCKGVMEKSPQSSVSSKAQSHLAAIGVAICDSRDELLFELKKPLVSNGMNRNCVEIKALIEGLNAALALELSRVIFYCDSYSIFQFVRGRWAPKQRKVATLVNQVKHIREKFKFCHVSYVIRNDIKFAFKLARDAIISQMNRPAESSNSRTLYEACVICLEDTDIGHIFSIDDCLHRYCYSCMKQHVEAKLLQGLVPKCPHESCNSELKLDSCSKFLTPKLTEIMRQRLKEASIPIAEKVYCPYPKCSALMSRSEVLEHSRGSFKGPGSRRCVKCNGHFCINCKVPWHENMTCSEYKIKHPNGNEEDLKLKNLAKRNLWRQCVRCNHMIELAAGCYHMTCRCGCEFCYTCGAEWKDKKATCGCPLFEYDSDEDEYEDEDEDEDEDFGEEEEEQEIDFYDSDSDDYLF